MDDSKTWKTPPQIAKMLAVDPDKVVDWIRKGELDAYNVAAAPSKRARWRIRPEALERFLERRRSPGPAPKPKRSKKQDGVIDFY